MFNAFQIAQSPGSARTVRSQPPDPLLAHAANKKPEFEDHVVPGNRDVDASDTCYIVGAEDHHGEIELIGRFQQAGEEAVIHLEILIPDNSLRALFQE